MLEVLADSILTPKGARNMTKKVLPNTQIELSKSDRNLEAA